MPLRMIIYRSYLPRVLAVMVVCYLQCRMNYVPHMYMMMIHSLILLCIVLMHLGRKISIVHMFLSRVILILVLFTALQIFMEILRCLGMLFIFKHQFLGFIVFIPLLVALLLSM